MNIDGTFGLFEAALRHGRPTVLFASSVAAFGGRLPVMLADDTPQWPAAMGTGGRNGIQLGIPAGRAHGGGWQTR